MFILARYLKFHLITSAGKIFKYCGNMVKLITIHRSTASELTLNEAGETLSLRSMVPLHQVKTVELSYGEEEGAESQWVHRAHARFAKPSSYRYGT